MIIRQNFSNRKSVFPFSLLHFKNKKSVSLSEEYTFLLTKAKKRLV